MTMALRAGASAELVVPPSVRRRAGIKAGDSLEFEAARGVITIRKSQPLEDDEYTPAQRRMIQKRLEEAAEDVRQGRVYGPFSTHEELMASLARTGKQSASRRTPKRLKGG
jgi:bifunctional DNA-binding transcriptional regulator/antitoxin component of YhaV-PrlF toxin-antitoxin module